MTVLSGLLRGQVLEGLRRLAGDRRTGIDPHRGSATSRPHLDEVVMGAMRHGDCVRSATAPASAGVPAAAPMARMVAAGRLATPLVSRSSCSRSMTPHPSRAAAYNVSSDGDGGWAEGPVTGSRLWGGTDPPHAGNGCWFQPSISTRRAAYGGCNTSRPGDGRPLPARQVVEVVGGLSAAQYASMAARRMSFSSTSATVAHGACEPPQARLVLTRRDGRRDRLDTPFPCRPVEHAPQVRAVSDPRELAFVSPRCGQLRAVNRRPFAGPAHHVAHLAAVVPLRFRDQTVALVQRGADVDVGLAGNLVVQGVKLGAQLVEERLGGQ